MEPKNEWLGYYFAEQCRVTKDVLACTGPKNFVLYQFKLELTTVLLVYLCSPPGFGRALRYCSSCSLAFFNRDDTWLP